MGDMFDLTTVAQLSNVTFLPKDAASFYSGFKLHKISGKPPKNAV